MIKKRISNPSKKPLTIAKHSALVGQSLPKSAKKPRRIVPPPQSQRIMQRYVAGQSIREISRKEGRARETVTKIVRSEEMQGFVDQMREQFYGLGSDAMDAVQHNLRVRRDGQLGYRLLADIGVIPTLEERQTLAAMSQPEETEDQRIEKLVAAYTRMAMETRLAFGQPLPELDEDGEVAEVRSKVMNSPSQPHRRFPGEPLLKCKDSTR